jgi:membrane protein YdbS with pleckstrin-like domain
MELVPEPRTTEGPRPIHPAIRYVWLFSNCISVLVFGVFGSIFEFAMIRALHAPWSFPIIAPLLAIVIGAYAFGMVKRQWSAWKYEVTTHEVILSWGVWWQTTRLVPRDRIQHVDIKSGPLDRRFGLVHVGLYVAGAHGSVGSIPGLTPDEAEVLRSMLVETQAKHV